jgi:SAM-dependent MidA family methyltransferase
MSRLSAPYGDDSNPELVELIRAEIEQHGPITFARFMQLAITTPELGYYASGAARAGTSGDFLTAPETHPIFGAVVARQIAECRRLMGEPESFTVREFGAGQGTLAADILKSLSDETPKASRGLVYELADLSEPSVAAALAMLASQGFGAIARPAGDEPFRGVALANELLDALPFHRLVRHGGETLEIYTAFQDGRFADQLGPVSEAAAGELAVGLSLVDGQRIQVSPAVRAWVELLAHEIESGFALLIDYGYPQPSIHDPRRFPQGTLKTYRGHQVGGDPYADIGRRDITAHVDFSALSEAATRAGFDIVGLTTQAEFVAGLGIDGLLLEIQRRASLPEEYVAARSAVMELLDPRGLGRFRVLILSKNVPPGARLSGLAFRMPGH